MKIWSKQLLMIKPDESPYLMAAKSVRLLSKPGTYLYYTNAAQILTDTLSNRSVLKSPYRISCEVNSAYLYRSYILLRMPGIATIYTSNDSIRVLTEWDNHIYYVDKQYIPDGWVSVILSCENDKIILSVGSVQYTILDATQPTQRDTGYYTDIVLPEIYTGGIMVHNNIDVIKNVSALLL